MKMKTWNVKYLNFNNEIRFKEILAGENSTKNEIIGLTLDNEIRYSTDCMKEVLEVSWLSIKTIHSLTRNYYENTKKLQILIHSRKV